MEEIGQVRALIEKAVDSTSSEVDHRILKSIKSIVRYSDAELRLAESTLMTLMKRDHSQVRYLTILIIDELFMRSKLFRSLLVEKMDEFLSLSVGFRRNHPLPAPISVASLLRTKAIELLEKWMITFGVHYRQIRLGFDYLKHTLRFKFPDLQANATRIQQVRREREAKSKAILLNKFENLIQTFSCSKTEIESTIHEIGECLEIIRAREDDLVPDLAEDDEVEELRSLELREIRLDALKESEKVAESDENKAVFDAVKEMYKVLVRKHLVMADEWISVLIRVETTDNRLRDSKLKEIIDLRNCILSVKKKCEEEFGCGNVSEEEDDDVWEEEKIPSVQSPPPERKPGTGESPPEKMLPVPSPPPVAGESPGEKEVMSGRGREREAAMSAKRAMVAVVREHNEAVLLRAAMASSSSSRFGDDVVISRREGSKREKKKTLASMLRKNSTAKDRIAKKLMISRS